ncbi:TetR/AcrR family transcriptional regulator [Roseibium limicola]|uniref:TetR/AcrR family transcriptional regulator n=1 Tax=Roseibium limicola TaxID=2816037 RepID=A0A939ENF5_9HYPH|nr:TetR/AcrR family transcriptional regulator [Roseibium limicola]MBO0344194.1 TetR/AcrR family transcriptional regulator [Roseibium limicola]
MTDIANETGWRGSEDVWLQAAHDALIEAGIDGVRIQKLAQRMNLSRTSFYWFFKDRNALLDALIGQWRVKNTGNLIGRTEAYAETIAEAALNLHDCWFDESLFDSRLEFAMRGWGLQSPDVSQAIEEADAARLKALVDLFQRFGFAEEPADVRARTIYLTQIGYITMKVEENLEMRMKRVPAYVETFTGMRPSESELARFYARHGYSPA